MSESALQLAKEAAGANIGDGIPIYDTEHDATASALPTFADFAARLSRPVWVGARYGADAAPRLALAWVYSLPRFGTSDDAWKVFWAELTTPTWTYFGLANLQSVQTDEEFIEFDDGLSIRSRRFADLQDLLGWDRARINATLGDDWFRSGSPSSHVLIASQEVQKGPDNLVQGSIGTEWPRIQRLLLALRLAGPGDVRIGRLFFVRREDIPLIGGISSTARDTGLGPGELYDLTADRLVAVRALHARLHHFEQGSRDRLGNVAIALDRFSSTFERSWASPGDRLIDDVIALEAIAGTRNELAFTIAFRVSGMLESADVARLALFDSLKSFYRTRSDLVHGARLGPRATSDLGREPELRDIVRRLLRGLLRIADSAYDPTPNFMEKNVDGLLLVADERLKLIEAMGP